LSDATRTVRVRSQSVTLAPWSGDVLQLTDGR
jgi:hypothetical protein